MGACVTDVSFFFLQNHLFSCCVASESPPSFFLALAGAADRGGGGRGRARLQNVVGKVQ
jgi:hypothetical protein